MKKLVIGTGGDHLLGDDIEWVQTGLSEAVVALAKLAGQDFIALYGCVQSTAGGNRSWTAGWMLINGELCQVDAGSFAENTNNTWAIVESNDVAGQDTYEDATVQQTYKVRKAAITSNAGGATLHSNLKYFSDYLANPTESWSTPATILNGDWTFNICKFRKNKAFETQIIGDFLNLSFAGDNSDDVICTLPAAYRHQSANPIRIECPAIINSSRASVQVEIYANGQVKPLGLVAASNVQIFFNHTYPTDFL